MSQPDTKERILDAAEILFARDGFHFASLRAITTDAGANLAAVNYHFGSKEVLLEEVFKRRLIPLNAIRKERLEAVRDKAEAEGVVPATADVLAAFLVPTVEFCCKGSDAARHFSTLVARATSDPDDTIRNVFVHHIMPIFMFLFEMLKKALPGLDADTVFWRLHFSLGSTIHTMRLFSNLELLPEGLNHEIDIDQMIDELMAFVTAGVNR